MSDVSVPVVCGKPSPDGTLLCEMAVGHEGEHSAWSEEERQYSADAALGAAWRRCEAALPEGWHVCWLERHHVGDQEPGDFDAAAHDRDRWESEIGSGPTPTAALTVLAERLESRP